VTGNVVEMVRSHFAGNSSLKVGLVAAILFGASLSLVHFSLSREIAQAALVGMAGAFAMFLVGVIGGSGRRQTASRARPIGVLAEWPDRRPWAFAALTGVLLGLLSAVLSATKGKPIRELLALALLWGFGSFLSFGLASKLRSHLRARQHRRRTGL
jgi:MFS family permease